ncbi:hypothetical protein Vretimale_16977, partial [Volvox reticuliferus]
RERFVQPLDPDKLADFNHYLEMRAKEVQRLMPAAAGNLLIAQQRDKHRYARVRSGGYKPAFSRFEAGDYVYITERNRTNTLQVPTRENVLRVISVTPAGVATLKGRCGTERKENVTNLKPCHLPDLDPIVDVRLAVPSVDLACEVCGFPDQEESMLLCDSCGTGWHMHCLRPAVTKIPKGAWICSECSEAGVKVEDVERKELPAAPQVKAKPFPGAAQRRRDQVAASFDGRRVRRAFKDPVTLEKTSRDGTARYKGGGAGRQSYDIVYDDGLVETVSPSVVRRHLLQVEQPPAKALMTARSELPEQWDLREPAGVKRALALLMPGTQPTETLLARLAKRVPGGAAFLQRPGQPTPGQPECVETADEEIRPLLDTVDLSRCAGVLDPWTGKGNVARVLRKHGLLVHCNDVNPSHPADRHEDALQPDFYRRVLELWPYDAIVCSPLFALLDLALPLAVLFAPVVAMHVPGHFVTDAHDARRRYLKGLAKEGRLSLIMGLPRGRMGRRCMWIVVFASRSLRDKMLHEDARMDGAWVLS